MDAIKPSNGAMMYHDTKLLSETSPCRLHQVEATQTSRRLLDAVSGRTPSASATSAAVLSARPRAPGS